MTLTFPATDTAARAAEPPEPPLPPPQGEHDIVVKVKTDTVADDGETFTLTFNNVSATGGGGVLTTPMVITVGTSSTKDYDNNDDGYIEVSTLAQLNAIRWDMDGDGAPLSANATAWGTAFPGATADMGCPTTTTDADNNDCAWASS